MRVFLSLGALVALSFLFGCSQKTDAELAAEVELATIYSCSADGNCTHSHDKSLAELQSELAAKPDDLVLKTKVIHQAIGEKHPEVAVEQCEAILKKDPENEYAISHLATALAQTGDLNKAMYYGAKNLAKHPTAFNHLVVGHIFYRQGNMDRALEMFETALAKDPGNVEAIEGVERCKAAQ